jgi:hypothetical protein
MDCLQTKFASGFQEAPALGRLHSSKVAETLTATGQVSCLPRTWKFWSDTRTECVLPLGKPESSMIHKAPAKKSFNATAHYATR